MIGDTPEEKLEKQKSQLTAEIDYLKTLTKGTATYDAMMAKLTSKYGGDVKAMFNSPEAKKRFDEGGGFGQYTKESVIEVLGGSGDDTLMGYYKSASNYQDLQKRLVESQEEQVRWQEKLIEYNKRSDAGKFWSGEDPEKMRKYLDDALKNETIIRSRIVRAEGTENVKEYLAALNGAVQVDTGVTPPLSSGTGDLTSGNVTGTARQLVNAAPDTFNVKIDNLVKIDDQNVFTDGDEEEFQQRLVDAMVTALSSIKAQANR
jgi:hypothetical protein